MAEQVLSLSTAVLMVICILVLAWWCSRMLGKTWLKTSPCRNIRIIEQLRLGADKHLCLIEAGGKNYLLGISSAGIQLLTEIEGPLNEGNTAEKDKNFREIIEAYALKRQKKEEKDG